jgi:16S rRNA (guanine527-N7)-methyltransferase
VEELAKSIAQRFDLITSRAFSSLSDFLSLTTALLAPAGIWMAMKGKAPTPAEVAELEDLASGFHVKQVQALAVPQVQAERCLVWIEAKAP